MVLACEKYCQRYCQCDDHDGRRIARQNRNEAAAMKRHLSLFAAVGMCFLASINATHAQVRADTGSIAIGGSVTSSTVIIGIKQEKVDELVRDAKRPLEELTTQQRENI